MEEARRGSEFLPGSRSRTGGNMRFISINGVAADNGPVKMKFSMASAQGAGTAARAGRQGVEQQSLAD